MYNRDYLLHSKFRFYQIVWGHPNPVAFWWRQCATYPGMLLGSQITYLNMFAKIQRLQRAAILFFKMAPIFTMFSNILSHCSLLWWFKCHFCIIIWPKILLMICLYMFILISMILKFKMAAVLSNFPQFPWKTLKKAEVKMWACKSCMVINILLTCSS